MAVSALLGLAWLTALLAVRFDEGAAQPTCREFRKDCKWPLHSTITFHGCLNRTSAPESIVRAVEGVINLTLLRKLSDPEPCALRCYREDMSWASLNRTHCFCFFASNFSRKVMAQLLTAAEECLHCLDNKGKDKGFSCGSDDTLVFYSISTAYSPTIVDSVPQLTVVGQPPETRTTYVYDNRTKALSCSLHPPLKNDEIVLRYDWFKNEQRINTHNGSVNTLTINTQSSADEAVGNYTCYVTVDRPKVCSHALGCRKSLKPIVVLRHSAKPAVCLSPSLANATPRQTANSRPQSWTEGDTVIFTCNNSDTVVELTCTPSGAWSKSDTCALPESSLSPSVTVGQSGGGGSDGGVIAGAVIATLLLLVVFVLAFFLWRRHQQEKHDHDQVYESSSPVSKDSSQSQQEMVVHAYVQSGPDVYMSSMKSQPSAQQPGMVTLKNHDNIDGVNLHSSSQRFPEAPPPPDFLSASNSRMFEESSHSHYHEPTIVKSRPTTPAAEPSPAQIQPFPSYAEVKKVKDSVHYMKLDLPPASERPISTTTSNSEKTHYASIIPEHQLNAIRRGSTSSSTANSISPSYS